jgi:hypothetical protein
MVDGGFEEEMRDVLSFFKVSRSITSSVLRAISAAVSVPEHGM